MVFYIIAALMVISALIVITRVSPLYSALFFVVTLFLQAILFVTMGAYLVAVLQILLYAGAIMVLILFVIMLLNLSPKALKWRTISGERIVIGSAAFYLACILSIVMWFIYKRDVFEPAVSEVQGTVEGVGNVLIVKYAVPFELLSVLLLAAIVGAVVTSRRTGRS